MSRNAVMLIVVGLYLAWMLYIGLRTRHWVGDMKDYLVAGREIGLLVLTLGLFSIIAAGTTFSGATGLGYSHGMGGAIWGLSWAFAAFLSAIFFARLIRASGGYTLAEWIGMKYGLNSQIIISVPQIIGSICSGAAQIIGSAFILSGLMGWSYLTSVLVSGIIVIVYTYLGGLWAVAYTEVVQGFFCIAAVIITLAYLMINYGGMGFLAEKLPETYFKYPGLLGWGPTHGNWGLLTAIGCIWGYVMIVIPNTYIWTKSASSRSGKTASFSFIIAAILCILTLSFPIALIGMYGKAIGLELSNPQMVFGAIIKDIPSLLSAIILVGILSAIMSTASGAAIGAGSSAVRDLYQAPFRPKATPAELTLPTRIITTICWFLIVGLAIVFEKIGTLQMLGLAFAYYSVTFPSFVASFYFPKVKKNAVKYSVLISTVIVTFYVFSNVWQTPPYFVHPIWVGSGISLLLLLLLQVVLSNEVKTEDSVAYSPEESEKVLQLIANGREKMVFIMDSLHLEGKYSMAIVDDLIANGLVAREGNRGIKYQNLVITDKGLNYLNPSSESTKWLNSFGIAQEDAKLLSAIKNVQAHVKGTIRFDNKEHIHLIENNSGLSLSDIKNHVLFLQSKGLLTLRGVMRLQAGLTEQGYKLIQDMEHET